MKQEYTRAWISVREEILRQKGIHNRQDWYAQAPNKNSFTTKEYADKAGISLRGARHRLHSLVDEGLLSNTYLRHHPGLQRVWER